MQTCDPDITILEQRDGYMKYRHASGIPYQGKLVIEWEVIGVCTGLGKCWEGAVNEKPLLDCPVGPHFKNDCCPLSIVITKTEDVN